MAELGVLKYFYLVLQLLHLAVAINPNSSKVPDGNSAVNAKISDEVTDFHFTKLLDIRMEGKVEQFKSFLQNAVREEMSKTLVDNEDQAIYERHSEEEDTLPEIVLVRADRSGNTSTPSGTETLLILLDSLSKEIGQVRTTLNELNTEISSMKENGKPTTSSNLWTTQSIKCCNKCVGVNYNPHKVIKISHNHFPNETLPKNCKEVQENGYNVSGIYEIRPKKSAKSFMVLCDMDTDGGGWTHIQKRFDGSQDFFLEWRDYKFGFGDLEGEFWLGLENIYLLTGFEVNELLVEIVDRDNKTATAKYSAFGISSEVDGYRLNVLRGFSGDAGDSLVKHLGSKFSTKDLDQDGDYSNCAAVYKGGWWYKSCHVSNLNGKYINVNLPAAYKFQGLHWLTYRGHEYCHAKSRMLIRPTEK